MNIEIGKKIHSLRKLNGKKQEELARAIGVTAQAVSRWENEGSYPDLELLPSIAHYFGVTIDELFGYESDRTRRVEAYFDKIEAMNRENNGVDVSMDECVEFARQCLLEFPGEPKLIYALAATLYNAGYVRHGEYHLTDGEGYDVYDTERHRKYPEWREAIGLYEKALGQLENGPLRHRAVKELMQLYVNTGEARKSDALSVLSPDMSSCREILRIDGCDGRERAKRSGEAILAAAHQLATLIVAGVMIHCARMDPVEAAEYVRSAIQVYHIACPDGDFGVCNSALAHIHLYLSEQLWLSGDRDGAFEALDAALRHGKAYDGLLEETGPVYTSPLLRLVEPDRDEAPRTPIAPDLPTDWPWWAVPDFQQTKAEMESDPRWAAWVSRCRA